MAYRHGMSRSIALISVCCAVLAGCGTPAELRAPVGSATMPEPASLAAGAPLPAPGLEVVRLTGGPAIAMPPVSETAPAIPSATPRSDRGATP